MKLTFPLIALVAFMVDGFGAEALQLHFPARSLQSNSTSASQNVSDKTTSSRSNKTHEKDSSGSFSAPVAAPKPAPLQAPSGSFAAPVEAPSSGGDVPEPVTHHAIVSDSNSSAGLAHHVYKDTNTTSIILPEAKQPEYWPKFTAILFTVAAVVLLGMTARKVWNKRRNYEEVPTTLIV